MCLEGAGRASTPLSRLAQLKSLPAASSTSFFILNLRVAITRYALAWVKEQPRHCPACSLEAAHVLSHRRASC